MSVVLYKIVFEGKLAPGVEEPAARSSAAALFEVEEHAVAPLFSGRRVALKRHLCLERSEEYMAMLTAIGLDAHLEEDTPFDYKTAERLAGGATYDSASLDPWAGPLVTKAQLGQHAEAEILSVIGRIGRLRFIALQVVTISIGILCVLLLALAGGPLGMPLALLGFFLPSIPIYIQRAHDLNWSGWAVILCFVPYINIIVLLALLIFPGQAGSNKYGPPPPKRIKLSTWLLLSIAAACCIALAGGLTYLSTLPLSWR